MKIKTLVKILVDIIMLAAMPFLMGYMLIGTKLHEQIGTGIFLLFILHHILNYKWFVYVFKGKYSAVRIFNNAVNILVFVCMIGLMYSAIVMSRYVFSFIHINGGMALARKIHMLCSYWGIILMSIHLGVHWNFVMGFIRKFTKVKQSSVRSVTFKLFAFITAGYGVYGFIKRQFIDYLTLKIQFAFFDTSESLAVFLLDYSAVIGLFAVIGYYANTFLRRYGSKRNQGDLNEK